MAIVKTPNDFPDLKAIYGPTLDGRLIAPGLVKNALEELAGLRGRKADFDAAEAAQAKIHADIEALAAESEGRPVAVPATNHPPDAPTATTVNTPQLVIKDLPKA
jgi:hypothetical protein